MAIAFGYPVIVKRKSGVSAEPVYFSAGCWHHIYCLSIVMAEHVLCPKCSRPLRSLKQYHYCGKKDIKELFEGKPPTLYPLYKKLEKAVKKWPGTVFSASKTCIVFAAARTFLVVKPLKDSLDVNFVLPETREGFPIYKTSMYGKRHEHYIRLYDDDDLSPDVIDLIRISYGIAQ